MIVFPAIDLRQGRCVRLRQGRVEDETVYEEDPAAVARRWVAQGAAWLHVVNLDGALGDQGAANKQPVNLQRLTEIRRAVPETMLQFGGGLRSLDEVAAALDRGATRVVLGTIAVREPALVEEAIQRYGPERIVAGIDARGGQVATHGWRQTSDKTAVALGQAMRSIGLVRAVYTDIGRDGMLAGANILDTVALAEATGLGVIASGGVASLEDVRRLKAFEGSGIEGLIIGQALYTGQIKLAEAIETARGR
jgi:phosphoribosylformimino-5-aminoimidazole carboxamide ribotide isomerase